MQKKKTIALGCFTIVLLSLIALWVFSGKTHDMDSFQKTHSVQYKIDKSKPRPYVNPRPISQKEFGEQFSSFNVLSEEQFEGLFEEQIGDYQIAPRVYILHHTEINKIPRDATVLGRKGDFVFFTVPSKIHFLSNPIKIRDQFGAYTGKISVITDSFNHAQVVNFIGNHGPFDRVTIYDNIILIENLDVVKSAHFVDEFSKLMPDVKVQLDIFSKLPLN